jgi:hypothetical protein
LPDRFAELLSLNDLLTLPDRAGASVGAAIATINNRGKLLGLSSI